MRNPLQGRLRPTEPRLGHDRPLRAQPPLCPFTPFSPFGFTYIPAPRRAAQFCVSVRGRGEREKKGLPDLLDFATWLHRSATLRRRRRRTTTVITAAPRIRSILPPWTNRGARRQRETGWGPIIGNFFSTGHAETKDSWGNTEYRGEGMMINVHCYIRGS